MATFSTKSAEKLATCHPLLQLVMNRAIEVYDFTVLEGHRGEAAQTKAFKEGRSKVQWPDGKHNSLPSNAVDIAPYQPNGLELNNREELTHLAGVIKGIASVLGIRIRWGGDWDGDNDLDDNAFDDLFHFELEE